MLNYDFKIERVIEKIKELNAKKVALQFPEGLKIYATSITNEIESKTNSKVIIVGNACYGACDVADQDMMNLVDLIVHFGHTPLPLNYKIPVIFVESFSCINIEDSIKKSLKNLEGYDNIGLVTTTQHLNVLKK